MAYLTYRIGTGGATHAQLVGPRTNLGKGDWADGIRVSIAHPSVATLHASFEVIEGGYKVVDHSGGGTSIWGRAIPEMTLIDGMELRMGEVAVTFREGEVEQIPKTQPGLPPEALPRDLWLVVKEPGRKEPRRIALKKGDDLLIGSAEDADVRLSDPLVSKRHARLIREEQRLFLRAGGRNGTFVDHVPVEACPLLLRAQLRMGSCELHVEGPPEAEREGLEEFFGIFTSSQNMKELFPTMARMARDGDLSVLVSGENGTGKEAVVRALHAMSPRADKPFVGLSCADFPEQLLDAELFGALRGSYTGSVADRDGVFVQADGGTLFLDEVGELSAGAQAKLLRVLQEKTVRPLGSKKTFKVDVRVVAATNRDLLSEVEAGRFREDLYYRLFVLSLDLPPLRARGEDRVLLFRHFMQQSRPRETVQPLTEAVKACLRAHHWPGNVRELKNAAERTVSAAGTRKILAPEDIDFGKRRKRAPAGSDGLVQGRGQSLESVERQTIAIAMRDHRGNRKAAAAQLGISVVTLLKKLRDYGLEEEGK